MHWIRKCVTLLAALSFSADAQSLSDHPALKIVRKDGRDLQSIKFRGSNPNFKLGQCEGDCDKDGDCQGSLVCYQKDQGGSGIVPGCSGKDTSRNDFCIDPADLNIPPVGPPPPAPPSPGPPPTPGPSSTDQNFKLKLWWQEGYYWQEETFERKWCMRCRHGSCSLDDKVYIEECSEDGVQKFDFDQINGDEILIKLHGTNRCLERLYRDIYVKNCDQGNSLQRWWAKGGAFDEERFEISQLSATNLCVTQPHHPKPDEEVYLETCSQARDAQTSFWERCYSNSC